ncbi:MAG: MucB/RseB C-terminal domain-containing protein [Georgfuchsia sp.]
MKFCFACLTGFLITASAWADSNIDALQWLHRVAVSAKSLSYSGTFVYQCGSSTESSRISHVVDGDIDMEHIEMLDGSPREVVRIGDEVKTWLPETRRLVIERRSVQPRFPAVLPAGLSELTDYYSIRRSAPDRVAGFDAQPLLLEPRDNYRFQRQLWIDRKTGLLLKAETFSENGQQRESSAFTELHVGAAIDREAIKARFNRQAKDWRVQDVRSRETGSDDGLWEFRAVLPGFHQVASVIRQPQPDLPEGSQLVFSDGLAAISVFFEPLKADAPQPAVGQFAICALNVYKRVIGKYLILLMGDVPSHALKKFGDGIKARKP